MIPGIKIETEEIDLQDSTDKCHILRITDSYGKEIKIIIEFGKIIEHGENSSNQH